MDNTSLSSPCSSPPRLLDCDSHGQLLSQTEVELAALAAEDTTDNVCEQKQSTAKQLKGRSERHARPQWEAKLDSALSEADTVGDFATWGVLASPLSTLRISLSGLGELVLPVDAQLRQLAALPASAEVAVRDDGGGPLCLHEAVASASRALSLAAVEPRLRGLMLRVGGRVTTFPPAEGRTASPTSADPSSALPAALQLPPPRPPLVLSSYPTAAVELPPRRPPLILSPSIVHVGTQTAAASCPCAPPPRPPPPLAVLVLRLPVASAFAGGDELVVFCNDAVFSETDAARASPCPLGHAAFVAYRDGTESAVRVSCAHGGGGGAVRLELTYDLVVASSHSKGCLKAEGRRVAARAEGRRGCGARRRRKQAAAATVVPTCFASFRSRTCTPRRPQSAAGGTVSEHVFTSLASFHG